MAEQDTIISLPAEAPKPRPGTDPAEPGPSPKPVREPAPASVAEPQPAGATGLRLRQYRSLCQRSDCRPKHRRQSAVKRGDLLATIDPTPFQLALDEKRAKKTGAEAQLAVDRDVIAAAQAQLGLSQ